MACLSIMHEGINVPTACSGNAFVQANDCVRITKHREDVLVTVGVVQGLAALLTLFCSY